MRWSSFVRANEGNLVRKRAGKGERITLPVSPLTNEKWEEIGKALAERGYEINTDQTIRRIIRGPERVRKEGAR